MLISLLIRYLYPEYLTDLHNSSMVNWHLVIKLAVTAQSAVTG